MANGDLNWIANYIWGISLTKQTVEDAVQYPGLDNHAMGTIFEELVRRFNEENNEEAGEHWTPRDAVRLMARLIFFAVTAFDFPARADSRR
jgi:type I restriction-modification system DNA methylase subunit